MSMSVSPTQKCYSALCYLWRIGIKRAVVDVDHVVDGASKPKVLRSRSDSRIGEEEGHGHQSTEHHRVPTTQKLPVAHDTSLHRSENSHNVRDHVVSPGIVWAAFTGVGTSTRQEVGQEHVEQGIGQTYLFLSTRRSIQETQCLTNQSPGEPDQGGGQPQLFCGKETSQMCQEFRETVSTLAISRLGMSACFELFNGE